ncbi:GNAT family N-acetyltransferase [Roseibium algae]|uniref:GNAT family N-acetyltransferase n=1 Tax=Roseibium algae TaxID=3123038 RepID=A0ABU8TMC9_9HYPH
MTQLAEQCYAPWIDIIGSVPQPMAADYEKLIVQDEVWLKGPSSALNGSLVLRHAPDHLLLWSIAVSPSQKGAGLGNQLLYFTLQRARNLKLPAVRLFTNVRMESNRAWYERKGFREIERKFIGDKHVIFMERRV